MLNPIEVRDLVKVYNNEIKALDGISFNIKKNEIFALLGPNGAGKTTTIKILCTLIKPTEGTATVSGYDVVKNPRKVRESLGIVFQEPALDDKLTGKENLEYHAMLYGMNRRGRERKIKEMLKLVELEEHANMLVKYYSGGMRRKLEIARSMMHDPQILFLDEPTIGLDAQSRRKIWQYILKIKKEFDTTILLTTHYIEEAEKLSDRVAIMNRGKIKIIGKPADLKKKYEQERIRLMFRSMQEKNKAMEIIENSFKIHIKSPKNERVLDIWVNDSSKYLHEIIAKLASAKILPKEVAVKQPSLEDVYIDIVGYHSNEGLGDSAKYRMLRTARRWG